MLNCKLSILISAMGPASFNNEVVYIYLFLIVLFVSLSYAGKTYHFLATTIQHWHIKSFIKKFLHPNRLGILFLAILPNILLAESKGYYNNQLVYNDMMYICIFFVILLLSPIAIQKFIRWFKLKQQ